MGQMPQYIKFLSVSTGLAEPICAQVEGSIQLAAMLLQWIPRPRLQPPGVIPGKRDGNLHCIGNDRVSAKLKLLNGIKGSAGFTFIELLATILTLSLLISVSVPSLVRAKQRSLQEICQSNLRQIGLALQTYADANQERLPGPAFGLTQSAYDLESKHELAWFLATALHLPEPSANPVRAELFVCPASQGCAEPADFRAQRKSYLLNESVLLGKAERVPPFGRPVAPLAAPRKLSELAASVRMGRVWAIADADKGNVNPTLPAWNNLPYQPVHGAVRNRLYFDWHTAPERW